MIIAYGLAGLIAPGMAGALFASQGSYEPTLVLSLVLSGLSAGIAVLGPLRSMRGKTST